LVAAAPARAGSIEWICRCDGEKFQFDPRDAEYMRQWGLAHEREHCGGGSASIAGPVSTGDPALDLLMPVVQQASQQLGEAIAREIFGFRDPAEERRLAELRRIEREREAELERQRQLELERRRRELHAQLMRDMIQIGSTGELSLLGLEPSAPLESADAESLPLLGLDESLDAEDGVRPAGTAFFGLGGGGPHDRDRTSSGSERPIQLRDLLRAAYLAERAHLAPSDGEAWMREAERALEGDTTLIVDAPEHFDLEDAEGKLVDLRRAQRHLAGARADLRSAEQTSTQADQILAATERAQQRAKDTLERMQQQGSSPAEQARQRSLSAELERARRLALAARANAARELELARALYQWAKRGRTQQLATLDGSAWQEMSEGERRSYAQLQAIYHRKFDVPPPELPGAIARAENGRRATARIEEIERALEQIPEAERQDLDTTLEDARRSAEMLSHYDRVINAHTRRRVQNMQQLEQIPASARGEMQALASESVELLGGSIGRFRDRGNRIFSDPEFREVARGLSIESKLSDALGLRSEADALAEAMRSGEISFDDAAKLSQRATGWATDLAAELDTLRRAHPKLARRLAGPIGSWIQSAHGVARATEHTAEIALLHQQAEQLDAELGQSARQLRDIKDRYEQKVDQFRTERRRLEEELARHPHIRPSAASTDRP